MGGAVNAYAYTQVSRSSIMISHLANVTSAIFYMILGARLSDIDPHCDITVFAYFKLRLAAFIKESGSPSKNMMSDFATKGIAKYPKSSPKTKIAQNSARASCLALLAIQLVRFTATFSKQFF